MRLGDLPCGEAKLSSITIKNESVYRNVNEINNRLKNIHKNATDTLFMEIFDPIEREGTEFKRQCYTTVTKKKLFQIFNPTGISTCAY